MLMLNLVLCHEILTGYLKLYEALLEVNKSWAVRLYIISRSQNTLRHSMLRKPPAQKPNPNTGELEVMSILRTLDRTESGQ